MYLGFSLDLLWAVCALSRFKKLRGPGAWRAHCPGGPCILYTFLVLAAWFTECTMKAVSSVLCVSSRELISGCDTPDRCELSRISGRCG